MKKSRKSVYPAGSTWPLWWSSVQIKNIKKKTGQRFILEAQGINPHGYLTNFFVKTVPLIPVNVFAMYIDLSSRILSHHVIHGMQMSECTINNFGLTTSCCKLKGGNNKVGFGLCKVLLYH
jgi:hypothetical protein